MKKHPTVALENPRLTRRFFPWRCRQSIPLRNSRALAPAPERLPARNTLCDFRAPQPLPFRASGAKTGSDALLNQRALELSHRTDDLKHEPPAGRAIKIVLQTDELHTERLKFSERSYQMLSERANRSSFQTTITSNFLWRASARSRFGSGRDLSTRYSGQRTPRPATTLAILRRVACRSTALRDFAGRCLCLPERKRATKLFHKPPCFSSKMGVQANDLRAPFQCNANKCYCNMIRRESCGECAPSRLNGECYRPLEPSFPRLPRYLRAAYPEGHSQVETGVRDL